MNNTNAQANVNQPANSSGVGVGTQQVNQDKNAGIGQQVVMPPTNPALAPPQAQSHPDTNQTQKPAQQPQNPQIKEQVQATTPQPVDVSQQQVSGDKERVEIGPKSVDLSETAPIVELKEHHEFEPEVEGWLEKLEQGHEMKLPEPVKHDGKVVVADASVGPTEDKIVLPMSQRGVTQGMKQKVVTSARWLAEWCTRLIKMMGNQVQYKQSQPTQ